MSKFAMEPVEAICMECEGTFLKTHSRQNYCSEICRLESKLEDGENGCRNYTGALFKSGYGAVRVAGKTMTAHRLMYTLRKGDPGELFVCHTCDNRKCANIDHLFLGTCADNTHDMINKGRQQDYSAMQRGEDRYNASVTNEIAREIKRRALSGERNVDLAKAFGVTESFVSGLRHGRVWKHIT